MVGCCFPDSGKNPEREFLATRLGVEIGLKFVPDRNIKVDKKRVKCKFNWICKEKLYVTPPGLREGDGSSLLQS